MPDLPALSADEVLRVLRRAGFVPMRQSGSHVFLYNQDTGKRTVVARHSGDVKRATVLTIIKQAGLTVDEFLALLRS